MDDAKLEERLVRLEQAVANALGLLVAGRVDEARDVLSGCLAGPAASAASERISDQELERAFASAQPETDQMRNADDVAHAAILHVDGTLDDAGAPEIAETDEIGEPFATETMAGLLERQGDSEAAEQIRAALAGGSARRPRRQDVMETLERWLDNLRGGDRA